MYNLGALLGREAEETQDAAQKQALAREAATLFQQYVAALPDSPQSVAARAGVANMMMLAGDTSAVATMYADQIANPRNYSDMQLVQAGVVAARAEKAADAAKLFEAALTVNAYNRDALYNLAASYWAMNEFDKMFPLLQRLMQLDPSNPDNLRLVAYGYQGKQKALTQQSQAAQRRVMTDSIVKYVEQAEGLPQNVVVDDFSRGSAESTLGGRVVNKGTAPKTFRITIEFLNAEGAVVGTQEANVGPVNANEAAPFNVSIAQPNVVGWRYRIQS
jgi:tetratricopeptide (TPR) repeat protein